MKNKKITKLINQHSRLEARVSPNLKNLFVRAAKIQGVSLTDFIISTAKKEAESVLKLQSLINLSLRDMSLLVENCVSNTEPTNKLKQAAIRFKSIKNN
jgi:uncharacterized protein (DUF1778 family)